MNSGPADYKSGKAKIENGAQFEDISINSWASSEIESDGTSTGIAKPVYQIEAGKGDFIVSMKDVMSFLNVQYEADKLKAERKGKSSDDTIRGARGAILNFLETNGGNVIEIKKGKLGRIDDITSMINYESVVKFNKYLNNLNSGTPGRYVKLFLKYLGNSRAEPLILGWIAAISYSKEKEENLFTKTGTKEKANIDLKMVHADLRMYYDLITKTNRRLQTKRPALRNIVNILFGVTTGMRPYEMNRVTWEMLEEADREISYPDGHIKGEGYFIMPADATKTHKGRVIPIHPQIKPYLSLLREIYPDSEKPFDVMNFGRLKESAEAELKLAQMRNFSVKYLSSKSIGLDEFIRIAIMGHDEAAIKDALGRDKSANGEHAEALEQKFRYGKYSDQAIYAEYIDTVGKKFNPIPEWMELSEIRKGLLGILKN